VQPGQIVGLLGPNGSGKTTALNLISGVLRPDSGNIRFAGQAIEGMPAYRIARLGLARRVEFVLSDLFADVGERPFDLVVSNPPYIPADEYVALEPNVRDYEPRLALYGGVDGLDFYRRLIPGAALLLLAGRLAWRFGPPAGILTTAILAGWLGLFGLTRTARLDVPEAAGAKATGWTVTPGCGPPSTR